MSSIYFFHLPFMRMLFFLDIGGCCRKLTLKSLLYRFPRHRLFFGFVFHLHITYHRRKIDTSDYENNEKVQIIMIWYIYLSLLSVQFFSSVSSANLRLQQTTRNRGLHFYVAWECNNQKNTYCCQHSIILMSKFRI